MGVEDIPRPHGSYDPDEPMVIPYADLIAARNAVSQLVAMLNDTLDPPSDFRKTEVQLGVRLAVVRDGEPHTFDTFSEAVTWLTELRGRLTRLLPDPPLPQQPPA